MADDECCTPTHTRWILFAYKTTFSVVATTTAPAAVRRVGELALRPVKQKENKKCDKSPYTCDSRSTNDIGQHAEIRFFGAPLAPAPTHTRLLGRLLRVFLYFLSHTYTRCTVRRNDNTNLNDTFSSFLKRKFFSFHKKNFYFPPFTFHWGSHLPGNPRISTDIFSRFHKIFDYHALLPVEETR